MFIPYGTDAPIYHWPWATGVLVLANIIVMILQYVNPDGVPPHEAFQQFQLICGDGLHPIQWVTSNFMHIGVPHLIGNMVFLGIFGFIVEGKIGWWMFTALYLSIGVMACAVDQLVFLPFVDYEGIYWLGAEGPIFGVMMVAVIWAPQDNIKMVLVFRAMFSILRMKALGFDVPVLMFSLIFVVWSFAVPVFLGMPIVLTLVNIVAGTLGLTMGVVLLLSSWVDCEQRDLISMFRELAGYEPFKKQLTHAEKEALREQKRQRIQERKDNLVLYRRSIAAHLLAGNPDAAVKTFRQIQKIDGTADWEQSELLSLISAFQKRSNWDSVILYSRKYLAEQSLKRSTVAINLAKVLLVERHSPRKAMDVIKSLGDLNQLPDKQKSIIRQIVARGNKMIAEGAIELD